MKDKPIKAKNSYSIIRNFLSSIRSQWIRFSMRFERTLWFLPKKIYLKFVLPLILVCFIFLFFKTSSEPLLDCLQGSFLEKLLNQYNE